MLNFPRFFPACIILNLSVILSHFFHEITGFHEWKKSHQICLESLTFLEVNPDGAVKITFKHGVPRKPWYIALSHLS
jgi:hypothetical protein